MSKKSRVWSKGTFATGTTGLGFIVVDPLSAAVSDLTSVYSSSSAYAGNFISAAAAAGVVAGTSNSEYVKAQIGANAAVAQCRVVSSGVRIRYIGTELNRGGQIVGLIEPTHDSLGGAVFADVNAQERSRLIPVLDRNWVTLTYFPVQKRESDFQTDVDPATRPLPAWFMAFAVNAASAGTPLTYEYEHFTNLEYTGRSVRGLTPSHVDYVGYSAVHAVSQTSNIDRPTIQPAQRREETFLEEISRYAGDALSWVGTHLETAAKVLGGAIAML